MLFLGILIFVGAEFAFADSRDCQDTFICINPGEFLKYEVTGDKEVIFEFGETFNDRQILLVEKGIEQDGAHYESEYILDKKTGDIFDLEKPGEVFSFFNKLIRIPIEINDPNFCQVEFFTLHEKRIDVITCVIDQKDSHSRLTYAPETGILMKSEIKASFEYLGETQTIDTYAKLIDTNIIQFPEKESRVETQIDPPSLEIDVGPADQSPQRIPDWVKTTMEWYIDGVISEDEMILALQYLVNIGVIKLE